MSIDNICKLATFVPNQDKNRIFLGQSLSQIANLPNMLDFSYEKIVKNAHTVDVMWFNERKMPHSFFEVEHTTNFKNSLNKFYELQDFCANFS